MNVSRRGFLGSMLGALAAGSAIVIPKAAPTKIAEFRDTGFRLAHVAVWSVALNDWEIDALAAGVSPTLIREGRGELVKYVPLYEPDIEREWTFMSERTLNRTFSQWFGRPIATVFE